MVMTSRSCTHIPNSTALVAAFWASAWTTSRTRLGSVLGRSVCPITDCLPQKHREMHRADTQPKLKPALLRLSAMVSQYFTRSARLLIVLSHLRSRFVQLQLCAHLL